MATATTGYTWASGNTVLPGLLNQMVNSATITLSNDEVTTAKILDANVTNAKLASDIDASKLTTGTLPIARIADGAVGNAKLADGTVVQVVSNTTSDLGTFSTAMPIDDTVPTSTEGSEIIAQSITPQTATNKVLVSANIFFVPSTFNYYGVAVFRGTTCIYASMVSLTGSNYAVPLFVQILDSPSTTSSTTYSIRIGDNAGTTFRVNGASAGRVFGATPKTSITLTEIKAS
jgi:hypothetical protein